jgi:hypothetical protein
LQVRPKQAFGKREAGQYPEAEDARVEKHPNSAGAMPDLRRRTVAPQVAELFLGLRVDAGALGCNAMNGLLSAAASFAAVGPIAYVLAVWLIGRGSTAAGSVVGFVLLVALESVAFVLLLIGLVVKFVR